MSRRFYPVAEPDIGPKEEQYVLDAVRSGWVSSLGEYIDRFEKEFAEFCDTEHAVAVSNGTVALELTLRALGVGRGDEVIVPALTFAAVAAAVVHTGAEPVFVDVDPEHWCLDPECVERAMTARTRAVIAVHSYGHPADMDALKAVCDPKGIPIIEDAAEAHGARYKGRRVGGIGLAGCFSFYGNKIITTGEGGMVTTSDPDLVQRLRHLKDHAMDPNRRYYHTEAGFNFRMTNVQAAMGCAQLERFPELLDKRQKILDWYREELGETLDLNPKAPWAEPVNWMVCAILRDGTREQRDSLLVRLKEKGVDTRPFFWPIPELPPYRGYRTIPVSGNPRWARLSAMGFNLPSGTLLDASSCGTIAREVLSALPGRSA